MIEAIERIVYSKDWITVVFTIIFILFALAKYNNNKRFKKLLPLLISKNYLVIYAKQTPILLNTFHIFFAIIQLFIFSLIIFIGVKTKNSIAKEFEITFFISILTSVFIFIVVRYFIGKILAVIFEKENEHEYFTYIKMSYLSNFSLLLFPLLIITLYINFDSSVLAYLVLIFALFILLFYYVMIIINNQKLIFRKLFYFILYLCALEVAPLIFLYKLFII